MQIKTLNSQVALLSLLPIALITGPLLPEILLLVSFILFFFVRDEIKLQKSNLYLIFILIIFNIFIILSSVFSDYIEQSIKNTLFYFRFFTYSILIAYICGKVNNFKKFIFYSFFISYCLLFFGSLVEFIFNYNVILGPKVGMILDSNNLPTAHAFESNKISSFFGDEWIMGSFISRTLPFYFALFFLNLKDLKKNEIILFFISLIFCVICILLSGERLALFFLLTFIFLIFFTVDYKKFFNIKIFLLVILVLSSLLFFMKDQRLRLLNYTFHQIYNKDKVIKFYSTEHHAHFVTAIQIFKDNKILGIGPKNFYLYCIDPEKNYSKDSCTTHPHNFFAQLLAETGLLGSIIPFGLFVFLLIKLINCFVVKFITHRNLNSNFETCCYISFFINLMLLTPNGSFFNNWLNMILYLPLGFYMFYKNEKNIN